MLMTITELLDEHGVDYRQSGQHKNVRSGWIGMNCPFCGGGNGKYHLGIELETGRCTCWTCGLHSIVDVLLAVTNADLPTCLRWAEGLIGRKEEASPVRGRLELPKGLKPMSKAHRRYLMDRGFAPTELANKWGLMGYGFMPGQVPRVFIPITYRGSTVSWTMRSITNQKPRYITAKPEQSTKPLNDFLFGQCHCLHTIIIVEGAFDVFRIGYGAAASMGLGLSQKQMLIAVNFPRRIICYDNEGPAQLRARKLCEEMSSFPGETFNVCLDAPDPGSASLEEIGKLRRSFLE